MTLCACLCHCFQVGRGPEPFKWVQIQNQLARYLEPENNVHIGTVMFKLVSRTPLKGTHGQYLSLKLWKRRDSLGFCFGRLLCKLQMDVVCRKLYLCEHKLMGTLLHAPCPTITIMPHSSPVIRMG